MRDGGTSTVSLPAETQDRLGELAARTDRTRDLLAAEGIERGLEDVPAGRVVPQEEVMAKARRIIEVARSNA